MFVYQCDADVSFSEEIQLSSIKLKIYMEVVNGLDLYKICQTVCDFAAGQIVCRLDH